MASIEFVKMEGLGNDYVYVDAIRQPGFPLDRAGDLARRWSDRHFGIGADGLIVLAPSEEADVAMRMFNADGSEGAMCGNGLRCLAVLAHAHGHVAERMRIATGAGISEVVLWIEKGVATGADAAIGEIQIAGAAEWVEVHGRRIEFWRGQAGNPHAVVFLEHDPESFPVVEIGAAMQVHDAFPGGVNVEFVQVLPDGSLRQRTFERGSGETMACGSGAATAALAAMQRGFVSGPRVSVHLRGGTLEVWTKGRILVIGGPARTVYRGQIDPMEC